MDFKAWHRKLQDLAIEQKLEWLVPEMEDYPEDGFEDGNTPEEELTDLISSCDR